MPNPYVFIAVILAWLASLWWWGDGQREEGRREVLVEAQAQANAAIAEANRLLVEAQQENTALKAGHEERVAAIAANIVQEEVRHGEEVRRAVRGARDLVLRQQPKPACGSAPDGGEAASTQPAPGSGDDGQGCKLPAEAVRDLFQLVGDADRDVRQLANCQATVIEYYRYAREACAP